LARTREELATALYQHDAAVRVIARLTKERDEARDSLSKVTVTDGAAAGEDMVVDSVELLPEELAAQVDQTHQRLVFLVFLSLTPLLTMQSFIAYPRAARSALFRRAGFPPTKCPHLSRQRPTLYLFHRPHHWISRAAMQWRVD
jgi:hypothetical protein